MMNIKIYEMIGRLTVEACEKGSRILELEKEISSIHHDMGFKEGVVMSGSGGNGGDGPESYSTPMTRIPSDDEVDKRAKSLLDEYEALPPADDSDEIDYKHLLKKYMGHVMDMEGASFIEEFPPFGGYIDTATHQELDCLNKIEKELVNDR